MPKRLLETYIHVSSNINKIGKWLPIINLFILAGLILDVFCFHGFNLWWLWVLLSLIVGSIYGKYISDKTKRETEERKEWEGEVDSIRQTFTDLERNSSIPPCSLSVSSHMSNSNNSS